MRETNLSVPFLRLPLRPVRDIITSTGGCAVVIYADELFILNLAVNYLALLGAAKICPHGAPRLRLLFGASLGAVYAVLCVLCGAEFLTHPVMKLAVGVLVSLAAFGGEKRLLKLTLSFFAVTLLFGGTVTAVLASFGRTPGSLFTPVTFRVLLISFVPAYAAVAFLSRRNAALRHEVIPVTVAYRGRSVELRALRDSGNELCEPLSGRAVMVCESETLLPLLSERAWEIILRNPDPADALPRLYSSGETDFRIVPYRTVSGSGFLLAFAPESVTAAGEKRENILVGLGTENLGGDYTAVINA